jgi:hypothetical protein
MIQSERKGTRSTYRHTQTLHQSNTQSKYSAPDTTDDATKSIVGTIRRTLVLNQRPIEGIGGRKNRTVSKPRNEKRRRENKFSYLDSE